jgi:Protein of unknown function (DUF3224)
MSLRLARRRAHAIALTGLVVTSTIGMASSARADDGRGRGWKKVAVTIEASSSTPTLVDSPCNGDDPTRCIFLVSFDATQVGDLEGRIIEGDAVTPLPAGGAISANSGIFVGTINGCGTGSFVFTAIQTYGADGSQTDVYTVVPGAGTGDLDGLTGGFTARSTPGAPAPLAGTVRCRRR